MKSVGARLPKCASPSFSKKVKESLAVEIREAAAAAGGVGGGLSDSIQGYDKKIEKLGSEKYGHAALLRQVKGVGPITALAYVLTLENPNRFAKSRDVGPYLGLVPNQVMSSERPDSSGDDELVYGHRNK